MSFGRVVDAGCLAWPVSGVGRLCGIREAGGDVVDGVAEFAAAVDVKGVGDGRKPLRRVHVWVAGRAAETAPLTSVGFFEVTHWWASYSHPVDMWVSSAATGSKSAGGAVVVAVESVRSSRMRSIR